MGLFDIFTGAPAKKAAQQQRSYLDQTQQTGNAGIESALGQSLGFVNQGANTAAPYLQAGYGNAGDILAQGTQGALGYVGAGAGGALGYLGQGAGNALGFVNQGTGGALGALGGGAGQAIQYLNQGQRGAVGQYGQARADLMGGSAAYDPLASLTGQYGQGRSLYQDSLGINGAQGNARAAGAFQPSLGYTFGLDQGLEAINRRRNAGGMLASGNADRDAQVFGQGLANQEVGKWQDRLAGFVSPELQAATSVAGGRANIAGNLANTDVGLAGLLSSGGTQRAGIATGLGSSQADVLRGGGNTAANIATGLGAAQAGVSTGAGNTLADVLRGGSAAMAGNAVNQGTSLANLYNQLGLTQSGLVQGAQGQKLGLTNAVLQPYNQTYGQEAAAQMQASGNLWNLGINVAKMAAGLPPGSFDFSGGGPTMAPSPNGPNTFSPMFPK